ncbi:MAG: glycosidase [Thermoproteota archaeon]
MTNVEERLYKKAVSFLKELKGTRENKIEDIFERKGLIVSDQDILVSNYSRKRPKLAFNPGALLEGKTLHVFPRLIFEYYTYVSSIGEFSVKVDDVLSGNLKLPVEARVIVWPKFLWEFRGCEDPRVFKDKEELLMLYTGYGYFLDGDKLTVDIVQALAKLDNNFSVVKRGYFKIRSIEGNYFVPRSNKDSALLKVEGDSAIMLTRPLIKDVELGWRARADLNEVIITEESMEPSLHFEDWEFKVGWSTNILKLSSNEFLVGWHSVVKEDYSYRNGLAIVDGEGRLLAISNYLLVPKGINEEYGDRPHVIFGNGLVSYKENLIWVGGVSDYAIGFFVTELDKALERMKWIRKK